jgi:hypothetical protein
MIQNEQSVVTKPKRIRKPKVEQSPDHQGLSQIQKDAIVQKLIQKEKAVIAENVVSPEKLKQQIAALQQENKELKSRVSRFVEERSSQREALELDKTAEFAKNNKNVSEEEYYRVKRFLFSYKQRFEALQERFDVLQADYDRLRKLRQI